MSDFTKLKARKNGKEYILNACTQDTEQNITGTKNFTKLTVNSKNVVTSINCVEADEFGNVNFGQGILGVEVDFTNGTFVRLADASGLQPGEDFNRYKMYNRKRCIMTDDGVVLAYYGEPGYTETGKLTEEITKDDVTYPVDTEVQVMVEQPKFYYKVVPLRTEDVVQNSERCTKLRKARYYVSDTMREGFKLHPAFIKNKVELDKVYMSAYEGSVENGKLWSRSGYAPQVYQTLAAVRNQAKTRGDRWDPCLIQFCWMNTLMFLIEYAEFNAQQALGFGQSSVSGPVKTGLTSELGNTTGKVYNSDTDVNCSVNYRGIENLYGNLWMLCDGLTQCNYLVYVADHDYVMNSAAEPNEREKGLQCCASNGAYISAFCYVPKYDWCFIPLEVRGDANKPVGDGFWVATGWRVCYYGGGFGISSYCGLSCLNLTDSSSFTYVDYGSRLCFR